MVGVGNPRVWTEEKIARELRSFMKAHGLVTMPPQNVLQGHGRADLAGAVRRNGGTQFWAERLGVPSAANLIGYKLGYNKKKNKQCKRCFAYNPQGYCNALKEIEPEPCFCFKTVEQHKKDVEAAEKRNRKTGYYGRYD